MDKRDEIACHALQGLVQRPGSTDENIAARAYRLADAMLKARETHTNDRPETVLG